MNQTSPLEQLAAFAICFVLGAASAVAMAIAARRPRSTSSPD